MSDTKKTKSQLIKNSNPSEDGYRGLKKISICTPKKSGKTHLTL